MNGQRVLLLGSRLYPNVQRRFLTQTTVLRDALGQPTLGRPLSQKGDSKIAKTNWNRPEGKVDRNGKQRPQQRRAVPEQRDWKRPADLDQKQAAKKQAKDRQRSSRPAESASQRKERLKRQEEVQKLMKQEEMEVQKLKSKQKGAQEEKQMRDVYIPEIINVANLSRILGIRLGNLVNFVIGTTKLTLFVQSKHCRLWRSWKWRTPRMIAVSILKKDRRECLMRAE